PPPRCPGGRCRGAAAMDHLDPVHVSLQPERPTGNLAAVRPCARRHAGCGADRWAIRQRRTRVGFRPRSRVRARFPRAPSAAACCESEAGAGTRMMITTSDGIRLHVRSVARGTRVRFVHEFSGEVHSWDAQVDFFSRHYRCTAYCARGYPPSDVPTNLQAYDQIRAAEDLADVVRAVADRSAHIVGLSMGGF